MNFIKKLFEALNSTKKLWQITLAAVVNIQLGFFFIMAAQFAVIGYLFDPIFDEFGFYHSIVLGSTLISLLLALPLYFIISKLLDLYRERIAVYCAKSRWLNQFGFFNHTTKKGRAIPPLDLALLIEGKDK